jgi:hypothetical protein
MRGNGAVMSSKFILGEKNRRSVTLNEKTTAVCEQISRIDGSPIFRQ